MLFACPNDSDMSRADTPFCVLSFASRSGTKSSYINITSHSVIDFTSHLSFIRKIQEGVLVDLLK